MDEKVTLSSLKISIIAIIERLLEEEIFYVNNQKLTCV